MFSKVRVRVQKCVSLRIKIKRQVATCNLRAILNGIIKLQDVRIGGNLAIILFLHLQQKGQKVADIHPRILEVVLVLTVEIHCRIISLLL